MSLKQNCAGAGYHVQFGPPDHCVDDGFHQAFLAQFPARLGARLYGTCLPLLIGCVQWQYGHSKSFSPAVGLSWPLSLESLANREMWTHVKRLSSQRQQQFIQHVCCRIVSSGLSTAQSHFRLSRLILTPVGSKIKSEAEFDNS